MTLREKENMIADKEIETFYGIDERKIFDDEPTENTAIELSEK